MGEPSEEHLNNVKDIFFQHISHDIRGAYFGVGSICAVIYDKVASGQPVTPQLAGSLMSASQNYKYMLNHFLEFSRFRMGTADEIDIAPVDVIAEIEQIVRLNQYLAAEKDIHIDIARQEGFPQTLLSDKWKISRIFYNVFVNALKFSPPHAVVRVQFGRVGDSWLLRVIDQGKGFQPDHLGHIFEPYSTRRSPDNPEGTGLGLYITHYLTKLLGGDITVDSTPGSGATVEVRFPLLTL